ncbi:hypothetical protein, partial [Burkholderia pseudomallei]|uniref:hypothetical protein n=1 Tax=Burkholderia pseudomallei TaxID=28450 RepID=UPI001C83A567
GPHYFYGGAYSGNNPSQRRDGTGDTLTIAIPSEIPDFRRCEWRAVSLLSDATVLPQSDVGKFADS